VYVLIPSYEPNERLIALVAELRTADPRIRILVVDDGSGERFAAVFDRAVLAGATVVHHAHNRGKGAALRTGFSWIRDHARGDVIVTADADGQHTVRDILAVANSTDPDGASLVLGCRAFDGDVPLRSRAGNAFARRLFRLAAGWSLGDTQTGLRGVPPAMIEWLLGVPGDRFEYEQRVLLGLTRAGFDAVEVEIETVYLEQNESSHFRPVIDSIRVMAPMLTFAASSLAGFVIDAVVLFVLQAFTGALIPSIVGARIISASANFALNRRVVFMRRGREHLTRQIVSYAVLAAILLASNIAWMEFLTSVGLPLWLAKVITELALFALSFRAQKNAVFSSHTAAGVRGDAAGADSSPRFTESHPAS